jgi:YfiH family protein
MARAAHEALFNRLLVMANILHSFPQVPPGVIAGWTSRQGGVSRAPYDSLNLGVHVGDDANDVVSNRAQLASALGADSIAWLNQVHGANVVEVSDSLIMAPTADASFTTTPRIALAILTADCVPVVVAASDGSCAGAAHAGWQGLDNGIIGKLLDALPLSNSKAEYLAWIGPSIRPQYYPVGEEVWSRFRRSYPQFLLPERAASHKRRLDLAGISAAQLKERGVRRIVDCGLCTYASDDLFSYRQANHAGSGNTGRIATLVMLARASRG